MASQILTVAKIAGDAATSVLERFQEWNALRAFDDPGDWAPDQWPQDVRNAADSLADRIRSNCHQPPIVFFAEFVDLWSFCPPQRFLGDHGLLQVYGDRYELSCLQLPLVAEATKELIELGSAGQHDEDRLFAQYVMNAAGAWREIAPDGILVMLRQVVGAAVEDHEIEASLAVTPPWLRVT